MKDNTPHANPLVVVFNEAMEKAKQMTPEQILEAIQENQRLIEELATANLARRTRLEILEKETGK